MKDVNQTESNDSQFSFSYFNNVWSTDSTVITLGDYHRRVTGPLWKPQTECYRKLKDNPKRENEARMVKQSMPVVIAEGTCRPRRSHAAANLETMNGLAMYDLDHTNQRTAEIKRLLSGLPYVAETHLSISGEGLKVLVYLDARTPEEYPLAYAICCQTLERIAAHPCDPQCARITQPCSCVWDADAYYNPTPQPYPWREELAADPALAQLAASTPAGSAHAFATAGNGTGIGNGTGYGIGNGKASPIPTTTEACGYVEAFARNFAQYHPYTKGNRHESMLALGRSARRKGFSKEEMEKLTSVMSVEIVGNGYTLRELQKDLSTGYQYVDLAYTPTSKPDLLTKPTTDNYRQNYSADPNEDEEELSINNEALRASSPSIPERVFQNLPSFIKKGMIAARNNRERDILLVGMLTNLSGCMPNVTISFDQRYYSPHLYCLVIASSASGKGLLTLTSRLPEAINNYLTGENKKKKEAYERELDAWEKANIPNKKGQSSAGTASSPKPEPPQYLYLCGAPNTSKNQLIRRLKVNGKLGLIINASELDMITGAMKQKCGQHDDVFRAAFHHEPVATDYKVDDQIICAEEPHLSLCFSGTLNQLILFIRSLGDGLYSRFIMLTSETSWKYRSAAPIKGKEDYDTLFKNLSREMLDMFFFLQQSPTEVTLSDSQWEEHTAYFTQLLDEVTSEKAEAPGSIVLRASLIVVRIAAILTVLRKCEGTLQMKEYICSDEDFHTAMDIVKTTISHSLLLTSSLPGDEIKPRPLKSYFRIAPIINTLDEKFTYKEFIAKAQTKGIIERSACRYLKVALEKQFVEKQGDMYIRLKKFTDK